MRLLLLILICLFASGCRGGENDSASADAKAEIEKWNLYVTLGNYLADDFNPAMDEYFTKFGPRASHRTKEQSKYMADYLFFLVDDKQLSREIELALAKAAHADGDLDQATYEMGIQLKEVWAELIKARDYYAAGDYESDDYAEAEAHARIYDAYMGLSATKTRFWDILTKEDAERRKRDILEMRGHGLTLRAAMLNAIDKGLALQELLNNLSITYGSQPSIEPEKFLTLYEEFNQSVTDFEVALNASANKINPEGIKPAALADFSRRINEAKASAADLVELHRLFGTLDESSKKASGTPEHFGQELGLLVDSYNSIAPAP